MSERYESVFKLTFQAAIRGTWDLAKWLLHCNLDLASRIPRIETVFALRRRVCGNNCEHSSLSDHQACGFAKFVVISTCSLYFIHVLCNWVTGQMQNCLAVT